jgi:hypothetical protein
MRTTLAAAGLLLAALALTGCSQGDGQARNRAHGAITVDGKPIPFGDIVITPDGAKKNTGAQGFANIRAGRYDTGAAGGKGYGGGPAIVKVTGFDKEGGKLICDAEFAVDFPTLGDAAQDINVPKNKAKGASGPDI